MNYSDRKTKESLAELEKKLQTEYRKAYQSMVSRWSEYINGKDEVVNGRVVHHKSLAERIAEEEKKYKEGLYTDKEWTAYCLAQIGRGEKFRAMSEALAERMSNTNKVAAAYVNDKTPYIYSLNANYQAYEIGKELDGVSFTMYDEQTVKNMITENGNYTEFRTLRVNPKRDYLWNTKQIQSAVTSGILQGKGIKNLTDSFMTVMQRNRNAAIRNARTAYTSAQNGGRMASLKQAKAQGINVQKQWLSAHDGRVRDSHAMLNGQIREIEEKFDNGLLYPADSSGAPAEVYNCRCTLTYIYPEWDEVESAEIYKSNALKGETYQQFMKRMTKLKKQETKLKNEYNNLVEKYGLNIPQTIEEYKKIKESEDHPVFKGFLNAIDKKHLDALTGRELYLHTYKKAVSELSGIKTSNGVEITSPSIHLTERIIGYHVGTGGERLGVDISTIKEVLTSNVSEISEVYERNGLASQTFKSNKVKVTINPQTGIIVQANPDRRA